MIRALGFSILTSVRFTVTALLLIVLLIVAVVLQIRDLLRPTSVTIDGKQREIFKDPKTGDGSKKSAKGLLTVERINGKLTLRDQLTLEEQQKARDEDRDELRFTVDGPGDRIFFNGYDQIRARVAEEAAK